MKKTFIALLIPLMFMATACTPQTTTNTPSGLQAATPGKDPQFSPPQEGDKVAIMETDLGTIKIRMFTRDVPVLTRNFMGLAQSGKYDGTPFHRVVKDFMIQGGDFTNKDGTGGYSYKGPDTMLPNEINPAYHHLYGTLSMAKTSAPVSIGSQFFIVTNKDGVPSLDGSYSPIGQVYEGMDVAEKIQNLQIPGTEKPSTIVNVKKVTVTTFTNDQTSSTQN